MNRNRRFLVVSLFGITLLAVWTFYKSRKQDLGHETVLVVNQNLKELADNNRQRLSSALTTTLESRKSKKEISKEIREIQATFKVLHEQRDLFNIEQLREEIFADLSHKKELISKIESSLLDHTKALQWFAEDQAIIRVLGIQFLSYLHRNGIEDPLKNSIHGILDRLKNSGKETYKGQFLDAEDLIMQWSTNLGKQSIGAVSPLAVEDLIKSLAEELKIDEREFNSKSELELVRSVGRGIALGLKEEYPWEELSKALKSQFPKTFGVKT